MSIEIEKLTDRDIRQFKREIQGYEKRKKIFLILGFVFMGLAIFFLFATIIFIALAVYEGSRGADYINYLYFDAFLALAITCGSTIVEAVIIMIVMFILRGVLFQKKTENRLAAIEEYEEYKKSQQIEAKHPIDNDDPVEVAGEVAD